MDPNITTGENGHIVLSLISQFCDSRLKEMSNKCSIEKIPKSQHGSIYSDVLSPGSSMSNGRGQSASGNPGCDIESSCVFLRNCTNSEIPNGELRIKRKPDLSRHIKQSSIREWMSSRPGESSIEGCEIIDVNANQDLSQCKESEVRNTSTDVNSLAKERLESYLPILRERVKNEKWANLRAIADLKSMLPHLQTHHDFNMQKDKPMERASTQEETDHGKDAKNSFGCKWDLEQGILFNNKSTTIVCYGLIDKPHSVKPQCLKRLFDCAGVSSLPLQSMMMTTQKQLYLVDGTARIKLQDFSGKLKYFEIVSGVVTAVMGRLNGTTLQVEDAIFATPCPPEWPVPRQSNIEMVFISGLNLGNENGSNVALDLLQDYLLGLSGSLYEQTQVISSRTKLFLVGNMITKSMKTKGKGSTNAEKLTKEYAKTLERLDNFLHPLVQTMEIFLIPGDNDLTLTSTLPQPPIHPKMLPESGAFPALKRLPNPARVHISVSSDHERDEQSSNPNSSESSSLTLTPDCSLLESSCAGLLKEDAQFIDMIVQSGRNIKQTMDYCDLSCPFEMTKRLLKWGHLHPTYCDNLHNCITAELTMQQDLFRLKGSLPHLVVIGNLSEFKSDSWNNSKIIGIPAFYNSHTAVILTKDFDVVPISFKLM